MDLKKHIRARAYMSGVERDQIRIKSTNEVFTPTELVQETLDKLPPEIFTEKTPLPLKQTGSKTLKSISTG